MTRWTPWSLGYAKGSSDWLVAALLGRVRLTVMCPELVEGHASTGSARIHPRPQLLDAITASKAAETYPQPVLTKPARKLNLD
jgi:hypothetical protein